jgi:predicted Zn-dependent peptidase
MSRIARQEIYFGKYLSMDEIVREVGSVTREQVRQLARQLFSNGNLSLTVLGPLTRSEIPDSVLAV